MLLIVLAVLCLIAGIVFLLSAIIMSSNLKRTRTARGVKILKKRRRSTVVLTLISFALCAALTMMQVVPMIQYNELVGGGYEWDTKYASLLKSSGEQKAYLYLPTAIEPYGDGFVLKNSRNEWFSFENVQNSSDETVWKWVFQGGNSLRVDKINLGGERLMELRLSENGKLYAKGSFPYMQYDSGKKVYDGVIASHVADFFCSGNTLFYITNKGELYSLGFNEYGQMGDSSNKNKTSAVQIKSDITFVSAGATHSLIVDEFGNLYACGDNSDSELGDGTMSNTSTPIKIMSGVDSVAAGNFFSVILAQNGDVYTCGRTTSGQCGNGTKNGTATPLKIAEGAKKVVADNASAAYMTEDGKVYVWGKNKAHGLSAGDSAFLNVPTLAAENAYDIALNDGSLAILTRDRTVLVTGKARTDTKNFTQTILDLSAKVPAEYVSPFKTDEKKPDINELGQ